MSERSAFEPESHAVGIHGYIVRGRHEDTQRVAGEPIVLRPGHHANRWQCGAKAHLDARTNARRPGWCAERQPVATNERTTLEAARAGRQVRAAAAAYQRHA